MNLSTPHIPLGISLDDGLNILREVSLEIEKTEKNTETFYKVIGDSFECGFYEKDNTVIASWYNDPIGRDNEDKLNLKVSLYLARYGDINDWESTLNNGYIQLFNNEKSGHSMAYGLHMDVIRINHALSSNQSH